MFELVPVLLIDTVALPALNTYLPKKANGTVDGEEILFGREIYPGIELADLVWSTSIGVEPVRA